MAAFISVYMGLLPRGPLSERAGQRESDGRQLQNVPPGLSFRLSEGIAGAESRETHEPASGEPLSAGESGKLVSRLPEIKSDKDDQAEFAKRLGTLPAPKVGKMLPVKFPSDSDLATPDTGTVASSVEVLRFSPEGEVALAPDLNVTFSQPMVAVTSQEQAAEYAPVEFSPQVEGRWRWLVTKTLMFDTDKRFPMATRFNARITAGIKSATGKRFRRTLPGHSARRRRRSNRWFRRTRSSGEMRSSLSVSTRQSTRML